MVGLGNNPNLILHFKVNKDLEEERQDINFIRSSQSGDQEDLKLQKFLMICLKYTMKPSPHCHHYPKLEICCTRQELEIIVIKIQELLI